MAATSVIEKTIIQGLGLNSISIQFDITNACNLSCAHCYHPHHKNDRAMSLEDWKSTIDNYARLLNLVRARPNIMICGGEPLASPYLFPLLDYITQKWNRTFVHITTNGTLVPRLIHKLVDYPLFFQVSLESPNETAHDAIRGKGSFKKAIDGIKALKENGFDVHVLVILSTRTKDEIPQMFRFAKELGVDSLNYTRAIPSGAGKHHFNSADSTLTGADLKEAMIAVVKWSRETQLPTNTDKPLYCLIDEQLGSSGHPGLQGLVIGYDGQIKASSRTDLKLGEIRTTELSKFYFSSRLFSDLRNRKIKGCSGCKYLGKCGGDRSFAYSTTGDFLGFDNGCWVKSNN